MVLRSGVLTLFISFYVDKAAENFIVGLFQQQQLSIYNRECRADFVVERVETAPLPAMQSSMMFSTLSPMVVAQKVGDLDQYLTPTDADFGRFFAVNWSINCVRCNLPWKWTRRLPSDWSSLSY